MKPSSQNLKASLEALDFVSPHFFKPGVPGPWDRQALGFVVVPSSPGFICLCAVSVCMRAASYSLTYSCYSELFMNLQVRSLGLMLQKTKVFFAKSSIQWLPG